MLEKINFFNVLTYILEYMNKKLSKKEVEVTIKKIFSNQPSKKEIKKVKKLAMSKNIKLGSLRKKFCKKCLTFFQPSNNKIRIKRPFKIIKCKHCGYVRRYRMK